jgi:phenylalanine-4-hydroxylase
VHEFEHRFDEVRRLEQWMENGRLNNVAPGEPAISEADLRSFLEAGH